MRRLVARQVAEIEGVCQLEQGRPQALSGPLRHRFVEAEVDRVLTLHERQVEPFDRTQAIALQPRRGELDLTDECASSSGSTDKAAPCRLRIGPRYSADREAHVLSQRAMS